MPITKATSHICLEKKRVAKSTKEEQQKQKTLNATVAATNKRKLEELEARSADFDLKEKLLKEKYDKLFEALEIKRKKLEKDASILEEKSKEIERSFKELAKKSEELVEKERLYAAHNFPLKQSKARRKRGPNKALKLFKLLSSKQKGRRRRKAIKYGVPVSLSTNESLKLLTQGRINQRQRRLINKASPKFFASEHSTHTRKKRILEDISWDSAAEIEIDGEKVKVISFAKAVLWRLQNIGIFNLPEVPQVTFGGDSGNGTFNFGFYFNNLKSSLADDNFFLLATFKGSESYENIKKVVDASLLDIDLLNEYGCLLEYFLVGDLKFLSICLGLQGCSSTYFCIWCLAKKSCPMEISDLRFLDDILNAGEKAKTKAAEVGYDNSSFKKFCKENHSICRPPIFAFIPMTHIVPPVMHIITGSVNYVLKLAANKQM
uniref:Uncharacterized protein n=1 Tax=Panagrolaimus sp. ES5 TaxID=591445 RepID=A0AC34G4Y0_9BILA